LVKKQKAESKKSG